MKRHETEERLRHRFCSLWARNSGDPEEGKKVFQALASRYNEEHRAYHTLEHVHFCLRMLDRARSFAADSGQMEAAIYFHDVVYDIGVPAGQNEERSADFADEHLSKALFFDLPSIRALILATKHDRVVSEPGEMMIVDIDLAGLGQPWKAFLENNRNVRQEYKDVPEDAFRKENGEILKRFLEKDPLYYLPFFQERYGTQAKQNLKKWLTRA